MSRPPARWLFLALSFTWGLPVSLAGAVWALVALLRGSRPRRFGLCLRFEVGEGWGGASFGWVFFTGRRPTAALMRHEHGHGIQNMLLGPFMLPLVSLPSTLRYHARNLAARLRPGHRLKPYDSAWFEAWATSLGNRLFAGEGEDG